MEAAAKEAVAGYTIYLRDFEAALRDAKATKTPASIPNYAGGPMLDATGDIISAYREKGLILTGQSQIMSVKITSTGKLADTLMIDMCVDSTNTSVLRATDKAFQGIGKFTINYASFQRQNGKWLLWNQDQEVVESC